MMLPVSPLLDEWGRFGPCEGDVNRRTEARSGGPPRSPYMGLDGLHGPNDRSGLEDEAELGDRRRLTEPSIPTSRGCTTHAPIAERPSSTAPAIPSAESRPEQVAAVVEDAAQHAHDQDPNSDGQMT